MQYSQEMPTLIERYTNYKGLGALTARHLQSDRIVCNSRLVQYF